MSTLWVYVAEYKRRGLHSVFIYLPARCVCNIEANMFIPFPGSLDPFKALSKKKNKRH